MADHEPRGSRLSGARARTEGWRPRHAPRSYRPEVAIEIKLQPGDIFFTRGSALLAWAVRLFTRSIGEKRTKVNHVGLVVEAGSERTASVVEALITVREHTLWSQYGPKSGSQVAVFRPLSLSAEQRSAIVGYARRQVGRRYGVFKLVAHLLDWLLLGAYVFRRLARNGRYPICSWLVAYAFDEVGVKLGEEPWAADPDDIWDHVRAHGDEFEVVRELSALHGSAGPRW